MPNIKSAEKRVLVIRKKQQINRSVMSEVKTAIKRFNNAIDTNRIDDAEKMLPQTMGIIDSAVSKGVLHKNNAANKKSSLSKRLFDVKSGKVAIVIKKDNKTIAAEKALAAKEAREAMRAGNAQKAAERAAAKEAESGAGGKRVTAKEAAKAAAKAKDKDNAKAVKDAEKASKKKPAKTAEKTEKTDAVDVQANESAEPAPAVKKTKKPKLPLNK